LGLASNERIKNLNKKTKEVDEVKNILQNQQVEPNEINDYLNSEYSSPLLNKQKAAQILLRPSVNLKSMIKEVASLNETLSGFENEILEQTEIQIKYDTYIEKERELVVKMSQLENLVIPDAFNYEKLTSLSNEAKQKLKKIQPKTLGQASRISGVNPSDVQILMLYMGR
jgi:tRNA uridine 5-carboxymethylaminomethyl modification enzyme